MEEGNFGSGEKEEREDEEDAGVLEECGEEPADEELQQEGEEGGGQVRSVVWGDGESDGRGVAPAAEEEGQPGDGARRHQ